MMFRSTNFFVLLIVALLSVATYAADEAFFSLRRGAYNVNEQEERLLRPKSSKAEPIMKSTKAPSMKSTKAPSMKSTTKAPSMKSTKAPSMKGTKAPSMKSTKAPSIKSSKARR